MGVHRLLAGGGDDVIEVTMEVVGIDDRTVHMESAAGHWCGVVLPDWRDVPKVHDRLRVTLDSGEFPVEIEQDGEVIWP